MDDFFYALLSKSFIATGSRTISSLLIKMGFSGGLALAVRFAVTAFLTGEGTDLFEKYVIPNSEGGQPAANPGAEQPSNVPSGASTSGSGEVSSSRPKPEWEIALDLPDREIAPTCLKSHVKTQLTYLFNIGKKNTVPEKTVESYIEPLSLDKATVGFAKSLLERIDRLQLEHYNRGNHIPFQFKTKAQKERLYSIMWEYVPQE